VIRTATSGCSCPGSAEQTTRPGTAEAHGGRATAAQGKNGSAAMTMWLPMLPAPGLGATSARDTAPSR